MMHRTRTALCFVAGLALTSCTSASDEAPDPTDGDCLTADAEREIGTNPAKTDSDGDGTDDCAEVACGSDPLDGREDCYACGWRHDDPGTLVSQGNDLGDTIENLVVYDQCMEAVRLWDFAGEYHILFMTTVS